MKNETYPLTDVVNKFQPPKKVKLLNRYRFIYIPTIRNSDPENENNDKRFIIALYDKPLTIKECKISDLGDRSTGVLYFEELPDIPHLLHHFDLEDGNK